MLSEKEISEALHASRIVPVGVKNPHGPLGLEQLAEAAQNIQDLDAAENHITKPISNQIWNSQ